MRALAKCNISCNEHSTRAVPVAEELPMGHGLKSAAQYFLDTYYYRQRMNFEKIVLRRGGGRYERLVIYL